MKKIFSILIVFVFCLPITGLSQKARVGVSGGFTVANMTGEVDSVKENGKTKGGFMFGLIVDAPINDHISFQPGIYYVQKGEVLKKDSKEKVFRALRYVEMPLNFLYNSNGSNANFFVGLGPSLSVGLPSSTVTKTEGGLKVSTDIVFGNTGIEDLKGVDWGVNGLAGVRFKCGWALSVNYTQGLRNLIPEGKAEGKLHNSFFGIQLGFLVNDK